MVIPGWKYLPPGGATGEVPTKNSGADGDISWAAGGGGGGGGFTVSSAAPGSPALGDRWLDSDTGVEYTWVEDGDSNQWVELPAPDGGGSSGLTSPQALARSLGS